MTYVYTILYIYTPVHSKSSYSHSFLLLFQAGEPVEWRPLSLRFAACFSWMTNHDFYGFIGGWDALIPMNFLFISFALVRQISPFKWGSSLKRLYLTATFSLQYDKNYKKPIQPPQIQLNSINYSSRTINGDQHLKYQWNHKIATFWAETIQELGCTFWAIPRVERHWNGDIKPLNPETGYRINFQKVFNHQQWGFKIGTRVRNYGCCLSHPTLEILIRLWWTVECKIGKPILSVRNVVWLEIWKIIGKICVLPGKWSRILVYILHRSKPKVSPSDNDLDLGSE